jgi:Zn-dependent protease
MADPTAPEAADMTDTTADDAERRRVANLAAVYRSAHRRSPEPPAPATPSPRRTGLRGTIAAALLLIAGKLKVLAALASVMKLQTLATMLLSIGVYATEWGWQFAAGFVLLIFVHELGHALVLRREGIPAGAPVFIPFVGAFITMQGRPRDAYVEAKVAMGGPVLGSLGAWVVLAAALALRQPLLAALAQAGILINLFNLIPVSPLDGGRIAGAFSRAFWVVGYALGILAFVILESPILAIVLVVGLVTLRAQWKNPVPGYHAITRTQRFAVGAAYAGLLVALVWTLPFAHALAARD